MNPLSSLKLNDDAVSLSDVLTATLSFDGIAPIAVTPPSPLLSEASRQSWQIKPWGEAKVSKLLDGQERWTQTYRLEPFVPGEAVNIEFAPFLVANGAASPVAITLPAKSVNVKSSLAEGAAELRSITGPETLPPLAQHSESWTPFLGILAALSLIIIAVIVRRIAAKRIAAAVVDANQTLAEIVAEPDSQRFADRLSRFLRERQQLTRQTTAEIAERLPDSPLVAILSRCDAARFAGELLGAEERDGLLAAARSLLETTK